MFGSTWFKMNGYSKENNNYVAFKINLYKPSILSQNYQFLSNLVD
jgi:hypothetical protein